MRAQKVVRLTPLEANELLSTDPAACLIDVRSTVEFQYVGHPSDALHIPWKDFPDWSEDPDFSAAVEKSLGGNAKDRPILLICRSGVRSMSAAERLAAAGFQHLYNVEEGFEGDKDAASHRGKINGWRFHGLPWEQG